MQVDGGLKTGLDVIKAAILGAESFGFGTGPMVALGCKYLRICHLNNCATGVATQDRQLRELHFTGVPEKVQRYFEFLAAEVREYLQQLGVEKLTDLIGRTDLLAPVESMTTKQAGLDTTAILKSAGIQSKHSLYCSASNPPNDPGKLNQQLLSSCSHAVKHKLSGQFSFTIRNRDRSVGAALSGFIATKWGQKGLHQHPLRLSFTGTAGQSFGVWNAPGLHLDLTGDANDYVGKGMAGGQLVLKPAATSHYVSNETVIMGNTCLYGATGGKLFAAGVAGERFAVRNGGAIAVVEGAGDHCCEYMTGGIVLVLGNVGINFGAGMTGGLAFVLDSDQSLSSKINGSLVEVISLQERVLQEHLRHLVHEHVEQTQSAHGQRILNHFDALLPHFKVVKPVDIDIYDVLGRKPRGTDEIRVQVM